MAWWFFRSKGKEPEPEAEPSSLPEVAPKPTAEGKLLDLQQSAGNQSAQRMIGERSGKTGGGSLPPVSAAGAQPLPRETRELMESRIGEDFTDVRVHADKEAADSAIALGANAYTTGRDIYFAPGKYAPESEEGQRLLAHELTHVVQQEGTPGGRELSGGVSDRAEVAEREAEAVADATTRGERMHPVALADKAVQRDEGKAPPGPVPNPYGTTVLLNSFGKKFPDAAKLIYKNPAAMKLVNEAEAAGVQFGGYAEDGPGKRAWAYAIGNTVYVPKARTDAVLAMRDFLFELNNALRAPKYAELDKEAAKGTKGSLTAKTFAYQIVEQEVEGMLRMGEIWFETKKAMAKPGEFDKYDSQFFLSEYKAFKAGKQSKADIINNVLKRVRGHEPHPEWTVEEYYADHYNSLSGGK